MLLGQVRSVGPKLAAKKFVMKKNDLYLSWHFKYGL